jgi:uncharacterized 2Fe-2S/4Fe-4S cluster protein (DUF4445 family)
MFRVMVQDLGRIVEARQGETLLEVLQREGIAIDSYCGGMGSCGKCLVRVTGGKVSRPSSLEEKHLGARLQEGFRLACQTVVLGDLECEVRHSLSGPSLILTETREVRVEELPVHRVRLRVEKPALSEVSSLQEMVEGLAFWNRAALVELSRLVGPDFGVELDVVGDGQMVRWVEPSRKDAFLGIAFDVGTTTVACELLDLERGVSLGRAGALNRQVQMGADVISRLRAIQDRPENLEKLQALVVETMNELLHEVCERAGVEEGRVFAVTVAGNTIMEHLFLGVSPLTIGVAPYVPTFRRAVVVDARALHLNVHPEAQVYLFPQVAGYVGGDVVGGVSAFDLDLQDRTILYVDIGTNGEMALLAHGVVWCCGTAAGPAFEGAQITCGTRATLGAVSAVEMEDGAVKVYTIGDVAPRGICGTGLIDLLAGLLKEGLIGPTGRFREKDPRWASHLVKDTSWAFVLSHEPRVVLTQEDVSQLQLAKAAIQAGRKILLKEAGLEENDIEEVILAGAFGSFINPESARRIGLIPVAIPSRAVGNASLFGAKRALLSRSFRDKTERLAHRSRYIELSARPDFQDYFFESLIFEVEEQEA